ncbi:MAG: PKD domain-containing protein [Planctomycetes bacterium]|nr:PKD domain-containing protein [Planctomycetota bacterium]
MSKRVSAPAATGYLFGLALVALLAWHWPLPETGRAAARATPPQPAAASAPKPPVRPAAAKQAEFGGLPLYFEANKGQTDPQVDFVSRGSGYTLYLTGREAVFSLRPQGEKDRARASASFRHHRERNQRAASTAAVLRMKLPGANAAPEARGLAELPGRIQYFKGTDPDGWRTGIPTYAKAQYAGVWPGIDLVYYGNEGLLEYDFVVAPGADARAIALDFEGAERIEVNDGGDLVLHTAAGPVVQRKPFAFQQVAGARRAVAADFELAENSRVTFRLGAYDATLPLVIDPTLLYSTFLGGTGGEDLTMLRVDDDGNAYVACETESLNFPGASGNFQATSAGDTDVFVAILNPSGSALLYGSYLGGSNSEFLGGIAIDGGAPLSTVSLTGFANAGGFPTTGSAFQTSAPNGNAFVTVLDPNQAGTAQMKYSSFIGSTNSFSEGRGVAVDGSGKPYVLGLTQADDFPVTGGVVQNVSGGGGGVFRSTDGGANWTLNGSSANGLISDFVGSLAIDPAATLTVYAGTANGVFRTTDGGTNWSAPANTGLGTVFIDAVAVVGGAPSTVYATTAGGIFRSTNGGDNWSASSGVSQKVYALAVDPVTTTNMYAATDSGVFKSTDGGANWSASSSGLPGSSVVALAVNPAAPATLYAGTKNNGVFKSTNGGTSWAAANTGLDAGAEISALAIDATAPNPVYAAMRGNDDSGGVFKTTNGGTSWSAVNTTVLTPADDLGEEDQNLLLADPGTADRVYASGGDRFYTTTNGGTLWNITGAGLRSRRLNALVQRPGTTGGTGVLYAGASRGPDFFVAKFDPTQSGSSSLVYATYLGGSGDEHVEEGACPIVVDSAGQAAIVGSTLSADYPLTAGTAFQTSNAGQTDYAVTLLAADATSLVYSTYLGGSGDEHGTGSLKTDGSDKLCLATNTVSSDFPTTSGVFQLTGQGGFDAVALKIDPTQSGASSLVFSTYIGSADHEELIGLAVDDAGVFFLSGQSLGTNFPVTTTALQGAAGGGGGDALVAVLAPDGTELLYASYLGGSLRDRSSTLGLDSAGHVYVAGETQSSNFPVKNAFQSTRKGESDSFVSKFENLIPQPVAVLGADVVEGAAPLAVQLNGTASSIPGGGSIATYHFDPGDGSGVTDVSAPADFLNHTYLTPGNYAATLAVTSSVGATSDSSPLAIVAGDDEVADGDLLATAMAIGVDHVKAAAGIHNDKMTLAGRINPAGLPADLTPATVDVTVNNQSMQQLVQNSTNPAARIIVTLQPTGTFKATVTGVRLGPIVGRRSDDSGTVTDTIRVGVDVSGVAIDTPSASSVVETAFVSSAGKKSSGKFSFTNNAVRNGAFRSEKTSASEGPALGYIFSAKGKSLAEFAVPAFPNGDITIRVGGTGGKSASGGKLITIPFAALLVTGATEETSTVKFNPKALTAPDPVLDQLKSFQIKNKQKVFSLVTKELDSTGIPASTDLATEHELALTIVVPTAGGDLTYTTGVELKRVAGSKKWAR